MVTQVFTPLLMFTCYLVDTMENLESLTQKFWNNSLSHEELALLLVLLEEHEQNTIHPVTTESSTDNDLISGTKSNEILQALHKRILNNNKSATIRFINYNRFTLISAACLIFIVCGVFLHGSGSVKTKRVALANAKIKESVIKRVVNSSSKMMQIILSDSSLLKLYPNSSITYQESFSDTERKVSLTGKAFFKVAKDKHRPFIVSSAYITTTALGTAFLVNMVSTDIVSVKLYEGKVVVRSTDTNNSLPEERYLIPGQELNYDNSTKKYAVLAFKESIPYKTDKKNAGNLREIPTSLQFNNESLNTVFHKLSTTYRIRITYQPTDIRNLSFTGKFSRIDDPVKILSIICGINGLEYKIRNKHVFIIKQH